MAQLNLDVTKVLPSISRMVSLHFVFCETIIVEGAMAHVDGGYVITTGQKNLEKGLPITEATLQQIAKILGVTDATDIRAIVVYGGPTEVRK
jgi:hypothetical protein